MDVLFGGHAAVLEEESSTAIEKVIVGLSIHKELPDWYRRYRCKPPQAATDLHFDIKTDKCLSRRAKKARL